MSNDFFKMRGIVKQYQMGNEVQTILKGIDLDIEEGEFLSILGPSGSGKSTLMNIIGCLDTPTSGEYILHGRMIRDLDENQLVVALLPDSGRSYLEKIFNDDWMRANGYGDIVERTSKPSLAEQYLNGAPSDEGAGDGLHN